MSNPVAVVVGVGSALGAAAAHAYGRAGYDVALLARTESKLASIGERLKADGITAGWTTADISDAASVTGAIQRFGKYAGRIDLLHYNAVAFRAGRPAELTAESLLEDLAVGAAGLLTVVSAAQPFMRQGGCVLATGSKTADQPMASAASLGVQKAALRNLVTALDKDLRKSGIRAASVTVKGTIAAGTPFDPKRIAEAFVGLATAAREGYADWSTEVAFPG